MKTFLILSFSLLASACSGQVTTGVDPEPRVACRALTPECMAMAEGISVEDWLAKTCDDPNNPDAWMCPIN